MLTFVQFIGEDSNEYLSTILQKHGGQYGSPDEKVKHLSPTVSVHSKKEWGNHRFVKHDGAGNPIAAVQVMSRGQGTGHVSTAFTHPDHRRQGHASELVQHAKKLFPKLTYSDDRSGDGKALVSSLTEAKVDGVHYHVHPFHTSHMVLAYHKDHNKGTPLMNPILAKAIKHPAGYTAKNLVGHTQIKHDEDGHFPEYTEVHHAWRRKGIATDMYDKSEEHTGKRLYPADNQSNDAKDFWRQYSRHSARKHERHLDR